MSAATVNQAAEDREAARRMLRRIVDNLDDDGEAYVYPIQQQIAAAKALTELEAESGAGQELLAMDLTDDQLVDIIARAQLVEKGEVAAKPPVDSPQVATISPQPDKPTGKSGSTLITPPATSLAARMAGLGEIAARAPANRQIAVEDDPLLA